MLLKLIEKSSSSINSLIKRPIHLSLIVYAEPLRKKKQINPLTTKKQFERKVRRLEREINRLEAIPLKLKPIIEQQLPPHVVRNLNNRKRQLSEDELDELKKLNENINKLWSIYKNLETFEEIKKIKNVATAQTIALNLLKNYYPHLYQQSIEIDSALIPYQVMNVKKHTSPNPSLYHCPDGREQDITKEWRL